MPKPNKTDKQPKSPLKAKLALWRAKRAAMTALPPEAPDSVYNPLAEAASDAERSFVYEPARDLQDLRLKLEVGWYVNADDPEGWEDYLQAMTLDIRHFAGPLMRGNRASMAALKAADARPPRDPNAPPTRSELAWAVHQLITLLGSEWGDGARPGGLKAASDEQLLAAIAGAPEPAIAYRPHDDPNADPDDWDEQHAWCCLLVHADKVPTVPWPDWVLTAAGAEEAIAA